MLKTLSAAALVAFAGGYASASLMGTSIDVTTSHTGDFGSVVTGSQAWGSTATYTDDFGFTYDVITNVDLFEEFENEVCFDFSEFSYDDLAGELGTATICGLAKAGLANEVFAFDGNGNQIGVGTAFDDCIEVTWEVDDTLPTPSLDEGDFKVYVVWNQVPAPGALALLGPAAGVALRRRRR